jgi:hypothetical protein
VGWANLSLKTGRDEEGSQQAAAHFPYTRPDLDSQFCVTPDKDRAA